LLTKKERERLLLEEFRSLCSRFPLGDIRDFESPDFLVGAKDKEIIGIELVDYVRGQNEKGSPYRQDEQLHQQIVAQAKIQVEKEITTSLEMHFCWYPHKNLKKDLVAPLTSQISEVVRQNIPLNACTVVSVHADQFTGVLRHYLCSLHLVRLNDTSESLWTSTMAGWPEVSLAEIQHLVDSKNKKVKDYRKNCNGVWLIIVADVEYMSSHVDLQPDVYTGLITTGFDEVIFWDRSQGNIVHLHLERSA